MSATNTEAGVSLRARLEAEGKPLVIDKFVFAYVPGQDHTQPISPVAGIPTEHVVYTYDIPEEYRAYINPNQVVYSCILGSDVGDFQCNWQGLYCSEYDTLITCATFPPFEKHAYNPATNTPGNNISRNQISTFTNAQKITGITVEAKVWQIDFTQRLKGIDERERASNRDIYGRASFLDDGWKLSNAGGAWRFEAGTAYVEGIRLALAEALPSTTPTYPCNVWLDVCMEPDLSDVVARATPLFLPEDQPGQDYTSTPPVKVDHYLEKVAHIDSVGNITDLRKISVNGPAMDDMARLSDVSDSMATLGETLREHVEATRVHGAASTATPNALMIRDAVGRVHVAAGAAAADAVNKGQLDEAINANRGFDTRQIVTVSGTYTASKTGIYKITGIGGGGGGGKGGAGNGGAGGASGGTTSFGAYLTVAGGGGGGGAGALGGGGGGGAGFVSSVYVRLTAGQAVAVTVGAGGAGGTTAATNTNGTNGTGTYAGVGGKYYQGGGGAPGASNGCSIVKDHTTGTGGCGAINALGYGNGGGGGGGGGTGPGGAAGPGATPGIDGTASSYGGNGGNGGNGAIIIEYAA